MQLLGQMEDFQQQVFHFCILAFIPSVQLETWALKEGQHFGEGPQLNQVQEIKVLESSGPFPSGEDFIKPLLELRDVGAPFLLRPRV